MEMLLQATPHDVIQVQAQANEIPAGVAMIKANEFWAKGYKGQGVKIAIIDSGCQVDHPDLKDRIIGGKNFTSEDNGDPSKYNDYNGHGTHVAGTIAASENGKGVIGVAPQAQLIILKTLDKQGNGTYEATIEAIKYAILEKVDIISMSLGGSVDVPALHEVIKKAVDQEILVVCAAANSGDGNALTSEYAYPGYYTEVISVGAILNKVRIAAFSNSNNQIDLVAPGVNIVSTFINNQYATLSGTSMAAPHVTGALALIINLGLKEYGRKLTELELYAQLIKRTVSMGLPKAQEGNGLLYLPIQDRLIQLYRQNII